MVEETKTEAMAIAPEPKPFVFLGVPAYDGTAETSTMTRCTSQAARQVRFVNFVEGCSALCHVYNKLWVYALGALPVDEKFTHFAMCHSDLVPDAWWLDVMMNEMKATGATVLSAVAAIKNAAGITSTAVGKPDDPWDYRRITCAEMQKMPATFTVDDVKASGIWPAAHTDGRCLLVNTGCMLVDLSWPGWHRMKPDGLTYEFCFRQDYRVQKWPSGKWLPEFWPEDWDMSRYVHRHGGKVVATKKVVTQHMGKQPYPSNVVWGNATDVEMDTFNQERATAFGAPRLE